MGMLLSGRKICLELEIGMFLIVCPNTYVSEWLPAYVDSGAFLFVARVPGSEFEASLQVFRIIRLMKFVFLVESTS